MNLSRLGLVFRLDFVQNAARPLLWILILMLALTSWGLSLGQVTISSGNSAVGGTKAWITSEFANGKMLSMVIFLFYSFFIAVAAGMAVMHDEERKVGELIHATPLSPGEYFWGKFLAVLASFLCVLAIHLGFSMFFNHVLPNPKAVEIRGPFALSHYLGPALFFGLPPMLFLAGTSFAIGARARRPILVFVLPVAAVLFCGFFLWNWSPSWLDPRINRLLMVLDPAGVRWLAETWLKVDRGVDFYNREAIGFDAPFLLSRLGFVFLGVGAVVLGQRHFAATLRGAAATRRGRKTAAPEATAARSEAAAARLAALGMSASPPGRLRTVADVLRFELTELRSQPGLYLFVPIILLQTFGTALVATGAFDTPLLITPGTVAVRTLNTLALLVCLLTLFYTVESLRRERHTGIASIYYATPARTVSILAGKMLANGVMGLVVVLATFVGAAVAILIQHRVALDLRPFLLVWGLALAPTFLLWTSFVLCLYALTANRYATYGLALGVMALTGYLQVTGKMNWVGNWDLWNVLRWSDMGPLQLNGAPLFWNRIFALGLTVFFLALGLRLFPRHDRDAVRTMHRLRPSALLRGALRLAPYAVVPIVAAVVLWVGIDRGFQGKGEEKRHKDYWKQNLATWKDIPLPGIARVEVDLDLQPGRRAFRMDGSYTLANRTEKPIRRFPLTGGTHWEDVAWAMNGSEYKPEDRTRLYIFTPPAPLAPGDSIRIGFRYRGVFPKGMTKNGGGTGEFILPSGVVLTSFSPSFIPVLGYQEEIGVDKENRYEPKVHADDFHEGITPPALGTGLPFTTRVRLTAPADYTLNSVGSLVSDSTRDGRRTVVWESDYPVRFFNVVAGRWKALEGDGTTVYYHPGHAYNVAEIGEGLEASRRYYSEWFYPFPWKRLKLSEFPALAFYAQGFPTNITFSEGIGFLTKSDPKTNTAFFVTAHEAAHQWWGNLLTPGKGPGGDILAEGMSHFSTILLLDQVKGERARIEFCKRIEEHYGDERVVDSERPLVEVDGSKDGDQTVVYNKGGWVFWMLLNRIGREADLAGLRAFIAAYKDGPDYPVLQDFVESMRPFAPDSSAYREFVDQWFFQVMVPEYRLSRGRRTETAEPLAAAKPPQSGTPNGFPAIETESRPVAAPAAGVPAGKGATDAQLAVTAAAPAASWVAQAWLENAGTGRMTVEVAATAGDRFDKEGKPSPAYRESRVTVTVGPKEGVDLTIPCSFQPDQVVVDPDVKVLQLRRNGALLRF